MWLGFRAAVLALMFVAFEATGYGSLQIDSNYLTLPAVAKDRKFYCVGVARRGSNGLESLRRYRLSGEGAVHHP